MKQNQNLECDIYEVFSKFAELSKIEMTKTMKSAVTACASEIRKNTKSSARAGIKTTNNHPFDSYHADEVWDAPRLSRMHDDLGEDIYRKVHIFGNRKKGSGSQTYRFIFLDYGTPDRYARTYKGKPLKKPRYLGRIQGRKWFVNAQAQVAPQMERIFTERIDKCINKLNNTKV